MKLNAEILSERLSEYYSTELYGKGDDALTLSAPELYMDNNDRFLENHVYLATVEHLPYRPAIEKNVVVVCIGDGSVLRYYKEHATVILIRKKHDFYAVYQTLQEIYALYSRWESSTLELFLDTPSVDGILQSAYPVFGCPIFVLDSSFALVASTYEPGQVPGWTRSFDGSLDPDAFLTFLREKDISMDVHGAFLLEMAEGNTLCVNLFDREDSYTGCLCLMQSKAVFSHGQKALAEHLARIVERAFEVNPSLHYQGSSDLRSILQCLMREAPLSRRQKLRLKGVNHTQNFCCLSLRNMEPGPTKPVKYICSMLEKFFPGSVFFEYRNSILGLAKEKTLIDARRPGDQFGRKMHELISGMDLCAGVSNSFTDLYLLRTYYEQAEAAIENGRLYGEAQPIYYFSDYALIEMVTNCLGGAPAEVFFPNGLRSLLSHDENGGISYLETLEVFLEENMSYTKAARRLFVHRSTLVERIDRLRQELTVYLNDPDARLQLMLTLKALELETRANKRTK